MRLLKSRLLVENGMPTVYHLIEMGLDGKGKIPIGFALAKGKKSDELVFFAFRDNQDNPIAMIETRSEAIEFVEAALANKAVKWRAKYIAPEPKQIDKNIIALMLPMAFDKEGWTAFSERDLDNMKRMLLLLKEY